MAHHIVSFSGGKDSTAMLLNMVDKGYRIDEVLFVDTTKEFPGMYEHIEKVEQYIGMPITRLKISFDYYFSEHVKTKGKNKGEKGYGFPLSNGRWCSALKRDTVAAYLQKFDSIVDYRGIAVDEAHRCERNGKSRFEVRYPLVEWGMTEDECLQDCYARGFDWAGLYKDFGRVSCWCCPLSRIGELRTLYRKYPELWARLLEMDNLNKRYFKNKYTVHDLDAKFKREGI